MEQWLTGNGKRGREDSGNDENGQTRQRTAPKRRSRQGTLLDCRKVIALDDVAVPQRAIEDALTELARHRSLSWSCVAPLDGSSTGSSSSSSAPSQSDAKSAQADDEEEEEQEERPVDAKMRRQRKKLERQVLSALELLDGTFVALEVLEKTKVGRTVNKVALGGGLPAHITDFARALVDKWKASAVAGKLRRKARKAAKIPVMRPV